ncbi:hypothetical protein ENBRE01_1286 [Enteropsectra breve]|nr:hypothetical protein ENBRE01_1286 [Enteropsectra breve]
MADVEVEKKAEIPTMFTSAKKNVTIKLASKDKKDINRVAREFYEFVQSFDRSVEVPVIVPTEEACFTTRKSPCGNGTATFSRIKLRVYQRLFKISANDEELGSVIEFLKNSHVDAQFELNH